MQLWIGLGNPGAQYALQRHNVGFMVADILAEAHGFSPWSKKFRSLIAEGRIGRQRILLLKPQTFMNDSGGAAGHNGLRSIDAALGPDFRRVRIGIGHPGPGRKDLVTPHVLGNYAKSEMEPLSDVLAAVAGEAEWLADGDDARFMSEVALRLQQAD